MFRILTPDGTEVATIEDNFPVPLRRTVELKRGHAEDSLAYQTDESGRPVITESGGLTLLHAPHSPNDITRVAYRLEPVPDHQVFEAVVEELPVLEPTLDEEDSEFINTEDANDPAEDYRDTVEDFSTTLPEDDGPDAEDSDVGGPLRRK